MAGRVATVTADPLNRIELIVERDETAICFNEAAVD